MTKMVSEKDAVRFARNTELVSEALNQGQYVHPLEMLFVLNCTQQAILESMYDNQTGEQSQEEQTVREQEAEG